MNFKATVAAIKDARLIGIIRSSDTARAIKTAHALVEGGIGVIELVQTIPAANTAIHELSQALAEAGVIVGTGTVLSRAEAEAAVAAGARYCVSPATIPEMIEACTELGVPSIPGAFTATEIVTARRLGATFVKVFPIGPVGAGYLQALRGPLPDVPLIPTGGVTLDLVAPLLRAGAVAVGPTADLTLPYSAAQGDFGAVTARARSYVALIETLDR